MLYVFQVDVGCMMTFEMDIVLKSVSALKQAIAAKCQIPADKQVLLVSGGESLEDDCRVSQYSAAGTDTNPIFLFNKSRLEQQQLFSQWQQQQSIQQQMQQQHLQSQMKRLKQQILDRSIQPSYEAVVRRTETAKELHQLTREMQYACECLLRDQHLQYQGWAAVIANLEDITSAFRDSAQHLQGNFSAFLNKRSHYLKLLNNFDKDLKDLADIEVPVELLQLDELSPNQRTCSLLDWISQKDRQCSLKQMADQCLQAVNQLDNEAFAELKEKSDLTLQLVENDQNKKIKKIEWRLHELDKMLSICKKLLNDQELLTAAFVAHQQSAHSLQDPSIFPDLCESHTTQLQLMFNNYTQMVATAKKFQAAKMELVLNLHSRLRVIVTCETELSDIRWKIFVYGENLRKLKRNLEVLEQVNAAPHVYKAAIQEINRRRQFSAKYKRWSTAVAEFGQRLYDEEMEKRSKLKSLLDGHFLKAIFTGLDDCLPQFATQKPPEFDTNLPNVPHVEISNEDIQFPELRCLNCMEVTNVANESKSEFCSAESVLMRSNQNNEMKISLVAAKCEKSTMELDAQTVKNNANLLQQPNKKENDFESTLIQAEKQEESLEMLEKRLRSEYEQKIEEMKAEMNAKLEAEKVRLQKEFEQAQKIKHEEAKLAIAKQTQNNNNNQSATNQSDQMMKVSKAECATITDETESDSTDPNAKVASNAVSCKLKGRSKAKKIHQMIESLKQDNQTKQTRIDELEFAKKLNSEFVQKLKQILSENDSESNRNLSSLIGREICNFFVNIYDENY